MTIKPTIAYAIIKKHKRKISALDIFADNDIEVDTQTEKLIRVIITPYEKTIKPIQTKTKPAKSKK
jgi:hypothetical protein